MWAGFTAYNTSNQKNTDVSKVLIRNELGYQYTGTDIPQADGTVGANDTAKIKHYFVAEKGNTAQNTSAKGWLSLKSILPILDTSLYLPTTVFKNLRLVIEYNTNNVQTNFTGTGSTTVEPLLIVDEILNSEKQAQITSQYNGVSFLAIEHDRLMVPAMVATDDVVQSISQNVG
jgi:hypothetical protein